jgi:hypothetical protein
VRRPGCDAVNNLVTFVNATQLFSALTWVMVSLDYWDSFRRVITGHGRSWDAAGAWAFALGLVQTGFTIRWLALGGGVIMVMPTSTLLVWAVLYLANAACALGILYTWRDWPTDLDSPQRRARVGLIMWLGVFASAFLLLWGTR